MGRAGLPASDTFIPAGERAGAVRLRMRFPAFQAQVGQPLIATGKGGGGGFLLGVLRGTKPTAFWSRSVEFSRLRDGGFFYGPDVEHTVEVDLGSLHPRACGGSFYWAQRHRGEHGGSEF